MKICCFAGHSRVSNTDRVETDLNNAIIGLIENKGVTSFYIGDKGGFDRLCARCVHNLKETYPFITSHLILAYLPKKDDAFNNYVSRFFDDAIYPEMKKHPQRFAILKRNEWMVDNSDFLIAYVENSLGGAYKTLTYAQKRKNIRIINTAIHCQATQFSSFSP